MQIKINCRKSKDGIWCKDPKVKRSLFGIGTRMCRLAQGKQCAYQDKLPKPEYAPVGQGGSEGATPLKGPCFIMCRDYNQTKENYQRR